MQISPISVSIFLSSKDYTMSSPSTATAFAPATVGNIAVGFDLLGHAIRGPGDWVTLRRIEGQPTVRLEEVGGVVSSLPEDPGENTATAGLVALIEDLDLDFGFAVSIRKGLALGSGMGGSAASAAASIVAASSLLASPLSTAQLFHYGLLGECVASGSPHGDNLAPALFGGIQLVSSLSPPRLISVPAPDGLFCALVHPHTRLDTAHARRLLDRSFSLHHFVTQSSHLATFLAACWTSDIDTLRHVLRDDLVEPLRAPLIPGFDTVKHAALEHGAIGCSISGAGPSLFAWCEGEEAAHEVARAMQSGFADHGLESDLFVSPIDAPGAHLVERIPDVI